MFKHDYKFDPTYGYSKQDLLSVGYPEAPDDFDDFWEQTLSESIAVALNIEQEPLDGPFPGHTLSKISFDTLGPVRVGAWLLEPRDISPTGGVVIGHGYGGRSEPDTQVDLTSRVAIFPCAPGFNLSAHSDIPNSALAHVVHGIGHRDTYILRACVASIWSAASVLLELVPAIKEHLYYAGVSFGGGLGALALPWDPRFKKGHLVVPTFGNHPIRLQCPCVGSGMAVEAYHRKHPEVIDVLRYYDAATAASRIRIPVLAAPALFDPVVPPPGQFAVCNALPEGSQKIILSAGHYYEYPEMMDEYKHVYKSLRNWFGEE